MIYTTHYITTQRIFRLYYILLSVLQHIVYSVCISYYVVYEIYIVFPSVRVNLMFIFIPSVIYTSVFHPHVTILYPV